MQKWTNAVTLWIWWTYPRSKSGLGGGGFKNLEFFMDVFYGWPLTGDQSLYSTDARPPANLLPERRTLQAPTQHHYNTLLFFLVHLYLFFTFLPVSSHRSGTLFFYRNAVPPQKLLPERRSGPFRPHYNTGYRYILAHCRVIIDK